MTRIGLPVPPGFTLSTEACLRSLDRGALPDDVWDETLAAVHPTRSTHRSPFWRERRHAAASLGPFRGEVLNARDDGHGSQPPVSLRLPSSGLPPGRTIAISQSDAARRFVQTFGKVVLGVDEMAFSGGYSASFENGVER